jgi:hypothetical protein
VPARDAHDCASALVFAGLYSLGDRPGGQLAVNDDAALETPTLRLSDREDFDPAPARVHAPGYGHDLRGPDVYAVYEGLGHAPLTFGLSAPARRSADDHPIGGP